MVPALRIFGQNVRLVAHRRISFVVERQRSVGQADVGIAAMAIGAAKHDRLGPVHRKRVGGGVAGNAAHALGGGFLLRLIAGRGWREHRFVIALDGLFAARSRQRATRQQREQQRHQPAVEAARRGDQAGHLSS